MRQFASFSRLPVRVKALFISVKPLSKLYCVVIYARVVYVFTEYLRHFMMLRGERIGLFSMTIAGAESADCIDILQPASLSPELILAMEEGFVMLRSAFKKAVLNKQWYTNVLAQIRINAFRIELAGGLYEDLLSSAAASIESEIAVGNAIYMLPSFYNHDCDPNAHIMWIDNADARLMALRDVEEGEELRICYIDASMARDARQAILTQGFGFQCNCLRCSSGD
ncbi:Histone-lysine N-methyltransferase ATXR4 [Citrus sinensis]|nr:Histone-lysine N-methyltransferase ATXR4 [Citrus sinensis]